MPRTETGEGTDTSRTLKEIQEHLMGVYVDRIGYEFQQCPSKDERLWFSHHIETHSTSPALAGPLSDERRKRISGLLSRSEEFDRFLGKKFPNLKRYGECGVAGSGRWQMEAVRSGDVAMTRTPGKAADTRLRGRRVHAPGPRHPLRARCQRYVSPAAPLTSANLGSIVVSLPHRGRLNLLTEPSLFAYDPSGLFSKIKGQPEFDPSTAPGATGDVISHLGGIRELDYDGSKVKIEMLQNPSHLEVSHTPASASIASSSSSAAKAHTRL